MSELSIRRAVAADFPAMAVIENDSDQNFAGTDLDWISRAEATPAEALMPMLDEGTIWVAEDDGAPIGFIAAGTDDGLFVIHQISVAQKAQRRGVGRLLMQAAIDHARTSGLPGLSLTTYRDVAWNAPWYAGFGFVDVPAGERHPVLADMLAHEAEAGHDPARRCAMTLTF